LIYRVDGELTRETCTHQLRLAREAVDAGAREMDLEKIERVDSTSLAFWLELERWSASRDVKLKWSGLPKQMLSIAQLVGMDTLIGHRKAG